MSTGIALPAWAQDERCARAAWSRLAEPGDATAGALVAGLGAVGALARVAEALAGGRLPSVPATTSGPGGGRADQDADAATGRAAAAGAAADRRGVHVAEGGVHAADGCDGAGETCAGGDVGPVGGVSVGLSHLSTRDRRRLEAALDRWAPRWTGLDPRRDLDLVAALGGGVLHPGDPGWPAGLDDLGVSAPVCLWVRGATGVGSLVQRSVALVGARASTSYGDHVATELAVGLADRRFTVVSGGAYGIDAAAHRGAVVAGGATVVVLAGGVDRPYPAGNAQLLRRVVETGGAVVSEVPPGAVPSRVRFLQRNRLIAAASRATVVVEAAWRSGALSTAAHATALLRPVGAVPGPVTSMASAGCHRILREGSAVCVTDAAEVAELAGGFGADLAPPRTGRPAETDGLGPEARRVLDALPVTRPATVASVARAAGLGEADVRGALGLLELEGLAVPDVSGWRRRRRAAERAAGA